MQSMRSFNTISDSRRHGSGLRRAKNAPDRMNGPARGRAAGYAGGEVRILWDVGQEPRKGRDPAGPVYSAMSMITSGQPSKASGAMAVPEGTFT